ncbi:TPA: hypothetical protein N0F65_004711 [Lagenidium giganteum]|uniref:Uncharacterized protein n=1 Tax=Lagenidium giganteum TaxID=4803 RepID=A0AAV2Z0F9_9STRA|nr:TPA: hypothetical protein N0F65_004711 [Lagenidium giganteum]
MPSWRIIPISISSRINRPAHTEPCLASQVRTRM